MAIITSRQDGERNNRGARVSHSSGRHIYLVMIAEIVSIIAPEFLNNLADYLISLLGNELLASPAGYFLSN
jgi:hypothetical protein